MEVISVARKRGERKTDERGAEEGRRKTPLVTEIISVARREESRRREEFPKREKERENARERRGRKEKEREEKRGKEEIGRLVLLAVASRRKQFPSR